MNVANVTIGGIIIGVGHGGTEGARAPLPPQKKSGKYLLAIIMYR